MSYKTLKLISHSRNHLIYECKLLCILEFLKSKLRLLIKSLKEFDKQSCAQKNNIKKLNNLKNMKTFNQVQSFNTMYNITRARTCLIYLNNIKRKTLENST